jgi:hypothetical protein
MMPLALLERGTQYHWVSSQAKDTCCMLDHSRSPGSPLWPSCVAAAPKLDEQGLGVAIEEVLAGVGWGAGEREGAALLLAAGDSRLVTVVDSLLGWQPCIRVHARK